MEIVKRDFGRAPAMKDILPRAKEFTDAAMGIDIPRLLSAARTTRRIGMTAAAMAGTHLQLEGDWTSARIVSAAYDSIRDVAEPTLVEHGADTAVDLLTSETTHNTLTHLSRTMDSYEFSKLTHRYRQTGDLLVMSEDGLVLADDFKMTAAMEAKRGGCPYANGPASAYFNRFTDHIVETYAEAHRTRMPAGWLQMVARSFSDR